MMLSRDGGRASLFLSQCFHGLGVVDGVVLDNALEEGPHIVDIVQEL